MPHGNDNLMYIRGCSFITADGTSDPGITLDPDTLAVSLYSLTDVWVNIGVGTPVAAAPSEKAASNGSFFVPSGIPFDVGISEGTDEKPQVLAAIQDSAGGNLYVYQRKEV
jgi:hypothetical protein